MLSLSTRIVPSGLRCSAASISALTILSRPTLHASVGRSLLVAPSPQTFRGYAKVQQDKAKVATQKEKERLDVKIEKEKAKIAARTEKEKAKLAAAKQKEKLRKEKEKLRKEKEKAKVAALKEREKAKAAKLKVKLKPWEAVDEQGKKIPLPSANRPKRQAPFILFVKDRLPKYKAEVSDGKFELPVAVRRVSEDWRALNPAERENYFKVYAANEGPYKKALAAWEASLTEEDRRRLSAYNRYLKSTPGKKGLSKVPPIAGKPAKPQNAFVRFYMQWRKEHPEEAKKSVREISGQVGQLWKTLSTEQKAPYEKAAKDALLDYQQSIDQWKQQQGGVSAVL